MITESSILKIIRDKIDLINDVDDDLLKNLSAYEKNVFKVVKDKMTKFTTEDGKVVMDEKTINALNSMDKAIANALQKGKAGRSKNTYPSDVQKYLKNFNEVQDYNKKIQKMVNGVPFKELDALVSPFKKQAIEDTLQGLTGSGVNTSFIEPIREQLFKDSVGGTTITEMEESISNFIMGNASEVGKFQSYVGQIARDSLHQFDGMINQSIANEYDLDAYQYVGSLKGTSRPQCRRWVARKVILKKDIPSLLNSAPMQGLIPETNTDNFAVYRGGYNCRHTAVPFKMTERELKRYQSQQYKEEVAKKEERVSNQSPSPASIDMNLTYKMKGKPKPSGLKDAKLDVVPDQFWNKMKSLGVNVADIRTFTGTGSSHYSERTKEVVINMTRRGKSEYVSKQVMFHEYGHNMEKVFIKQVWDYKTTRRGSWGYELIGKKGELYEKNFKDAEKLVRSQDTEFLRSFNGLQSWGQIAKYQAKYKGIYSTNEIDEMFGAMSDTIASLTNKKYGYGHDKSYFASGRGAYRRFEFFAHQTENYWLGNPVFEDHFPELYELMIKQHKNLLGL